MAGSNSGDGDVAGWQASGICGLALLCAVGTACAGGGLPRPSQARLTRALAMLSNAESTAGSDDQHARIQRLSGWRQYRLAVDALRRGDTNRASLWLDRAESDAELAFALSKRAVTVSEADRASARLEALRKQVGPPAPPSPAPSPSP